MNFNSSIVKFGKIDYFNNFKYEGMIKIDTLKEHGYGRIIWNDKSIFLDG